MRTPTPASLTPELRTLLQQTASDLVDRLYGPEGPPWGTRFEAIETLAIQLGQQLSAQMIEQAAARQAATHLPADLTTCPACAGPLQERPPEPRLVTTPTGEALWSEPQRFCDRCRKAFFPSVQESGT